LKTRLEESTKEMTLLRKQYGAGELKVRKLLHLFITIKALEIVLFLKKSTLLT